MTLTKITAERYVIKKNYISRTNEDNAELLLYAHSLTKAKPQILPKL